MESIPFIAWCLEHLNYWVVMLLMTIESSFIPFPSEVVVPPAAYMCATTGEQNVLLVVLAATVGACLGALINYVLARSATSTLCTTSIRPSKQARGRSEMSDLS